MTDVLPVSPTHTFDADPAAHEYVDGSQLDTQVANLCNAINAVNQAVGLVVDGANSLASHTVGARQLKAELLGMLADGLSPPLEACETVATSNVVLSGPQTINGYALVAGQRVCPVAQTDSTTNGPWVVQAGAWTRPTDFSTGAAILANTRVSILHGTYARYTYMLTTATTVGTTAQVWTCIDGGDWANMVLAGQFASLNAAISYIGSTKTTLVIESSVSVTADCAIPDTISCLFLRAGSIVTGAWAVTGMQMANDPAWQVFDTSGGGSVAFGFGVSIRPEWWGAVPDGATDSTAALQAAIDAAAGKNSVVLLGGTYNRQAFPVIDGYYISATLTVSTGQFKLKGNCTRASVITTDQAITMFEHDRSDGYMSGGLDIENVHFVGQERATAGVILHRLNFSQFTGLRIYHILGPAMYFTRLQDCGFINCDFRQCGDNVAGLYSWKCDLTDGANNALAFVNCTWERMRNISLWSGCEEFRFFGCKWHGNIAGVDYTNTHWAPSTAYTANMEVVPPCWVASTAYTLGQLVTKTSVNARYMYECTFAGTSGTGEPTWPTTPGTDVSDGGVTWTCRTLSNYQCTSSGTSGASIPVFSQVDNAETADGTLTWTRRYGPPDHGLLNFYYGNRNKVEGCTFSNPRSYAINANPHYDTECLIVTGCSFATVASYRMSARTSIRTAAYKWTLSAAGTGEYYLELAAGGDPSIYGVAACFENGSPISVGTLGALAAGSYGYGDNDTLGYETVYVRLSDSTDPDGKAADWVEYSYWNTCRHVQMGVGCLFLNGNGFESRTADHASYLTRGWDVQILATCVRCVGTNLHTAVPGRGFVQNAAGVYPEPLVFSHAEQENVHRYSRLGLYDAALGVRVAGEAYDRLDVLASGRIRFGHGTAVVDCALFSAVTDELCLASGDSLVPEASTGQRLGKHGYRFNGVLGSVSGGVTTGAVDITITSDDAIIAYSGTGGHSITLPKIETVTDTHIKGQLKLIINAGSGTACTLKVAGGHTIDGIAGATGIPLAAGRRLLVTNDHGTDWKTIASGGALGMQQASAYTVAALPAAGVAGRTAFATNGRKVGEGPGVGTGTLAYDDGTAWRRVGDDTTVAA